MRTLYYKIHIASVLMYLFNFGKLMPDSIGLDSSVSKTARYGLDGLVIESRWGRDVPNPSRLAMRPTKSSYTMGTGSFPGVKRTGRGVDHPPPSRAEVKESVDLYLYSPSGSRCIDTSFVEPKHVT